jgi:hypothetical protein
VRTEPHFGVIEKFKSVMAASNAVQLIDRRDCDLANRTEKTLKVSGFTLKTGDARLSSSVAVIAAAGNILCMDECAGRVLCLCRRS